MSNLFKLIRCLFDYFCLVVHIVADALCLSLSIDCVDFLYVDVTSQHIFLCLIFVWFSWFLFSLLFLLLSDLHIQFLDIWTYITNNKNLYYFHVHIFLSFLFAMCTIEIDERIKRNCSLKLILKVEFTFLSLLTRKTSVVYLELFARKLITSLDKKPSLSSWISSVNECWWSISELSDFSR